MNITKEITSFDEFEAWSGAVDTLNQIRKVDKMDELFSLAEMYFENSCTETELNDWLWFENDFIYERLGLTKDGELPPPPEIFVNLYDIVWDLDDEDDEEFEPVNLPTTISNVEFIRESLEDDTLETINDYLERTYGRTAKDAKYVEIEG